MKKLVNRSTDGTVKPLPKHVIKEYGSARKWKALKRYQIKAAYRALKELRHGSAFFPCGSGPVSRAMKELDAMYEVMRVEAWGR